MDGSVGVPVSARQENNVQWVALGILAGAVFILVGSITPVFYLFVAAAVGLILWETYRLYLRPIPVLGVSRRGVRLSIGNREVQRIAWEDLAEIQNPRHDSRSITLISRSGERIELRNVHSVAQPGLDAIASRLPARVKLTPERAAFVPLTKSAERARLVGGAVVLAAMAVGFYYASQLEDLPRLLGGLGVILAFGLGVWLISSALSNRTLAREPWRWNPDESAPNERLTIAEVARAQPGPQRLRPGTYVYPPYNKGRKSIHPLTTVLGAITVVILVGIASGIWSATAAFTLLWVPLAQLAVPRRFARQGDRVEIKGSEIIVTSPNGQTRRAPYRSETVSRLRPQFLTGRLFGYVEQYQGEDGEVQIDSRFLTPTNRPQYSPESPWQDLWRGRHLQKLNRD